MNKREVCLGRQTGRSALTALFAKHLAEGKKKEDFKAEMVKVKND